MSILRMKVECPRCGKIHEVAQGIDEVDCNCHLVCPSGSKPGDCSVSVADLHGQVGWPYGLHNNPVDESDDPMHVTYYCAIHGKYYYKTPIIIPVDWTLTKLPKKLQWHRGKI